MPTRNDMHEDDYSTDPDLQEGADASDIDNNGVWVENEYEGVLEEDNENDPWSFGEGELQGGDNDAEDYTFAMDNRSYTSANGLTLIPWPGFIYGITLAVCIMLGGLLYLFTASSPIEDALSAQIPTVDGGAAAQASSPAEASVLNQGDGRECRVSEHFPQTIRRWCGLITEQAEKRGLPPDLVAALILQESGGNPSAYSRSGAVGLMQVMPRDGLAASFMCINGPCFADRPSMEELKDPAFNVSYGTKMLAGLVNRRGSYREALKSYGPMNVGYYYADIVLRLFQRYGVN